MSDLNPRDVMQAKRDWKYLSSLMTAIGSVLESVEEPAKMARSLQLTVEGLQQQKAAAEAGITAANDKAAAILNEAEEKARARYAEAEAAMASARLADQAAEAALVEAQAKAAEIVKQAEIDAEAVIAKYADRTAAAKAEAEDASTEAQRVRGEAQHARDDLASAKATLQAFRDSLPKV